MKKVILYHDSKECVSATSNIANLDPKFVNGVLRVGGRLRNANIPLNAKHQMIIPKTHHVADLIIRHAHQESNHLGKNHTLSQLRRKYWIVQAGICHNHKIFSLESLNVTKIQGGALISSI